MSDLTAQIQKCKKLKAEAQARRSARTRGVVNVPRDFLGFCAWLGVELTPGQTELARVAFDGLEPMDRDIARALFGEALPVGRCRVVAAVCGRRAGKSYVLVALRLVHGMLVRNVPKLPPGTRAVAMIIAPRDSLRMEVFRYAMGAILSKPELAALLVGKPRVDSFELKRPDGISVYFETGVATAGGTAARGRWFTDIAFDECAFFRDDSYKVNDEELFRAGTATLLPGGQALVASTPWAEAGLLYRLWKERPEGTIVAHAPTLVLNDSPETREAVAQAEATDPDNAKREFGAEFMTSGTTVFFESMTLDAMLDDEPFVVMPRDIIGAGGDFAFRGDSSALLMVAMRGKDLHIFAGTEERPQPGEPLKPSHTVKRFVDVIAGRCTYVVADGHHRSSIEEHLMDHGLVYAPAPSTPSENYVRSRQLLREGLVRVHTANLPKDLVDRLLQQLRETQGRPTAGGGMSIMHPRWAKGGHGDLADAFTLALWKVCGEAVPMPKAEQGTREWEEAKRDERRQRLVDKLDRPEWMAKGKGSDRGADAHWRR